LLILLLLLVLLLILLLLLVLLLLVLLLVLLPLPQRHLEVVAGRVVLWVGAQRAPVRIDGVVPLLLLVLGVTEVVIGRRLQRGVARLRRLPEPLLRLLELARVLACLSELVERRPLVELDARVVLPLRRPVVPQRLLVPPGLERVVAVLDALVGRA